MLKLPENVNQFQCPGCGAIQDISGTLLTAPIEQEELRTAESPTPETPADDVFDDDALVIRRSDRDREWSPEPAREEAPPPSEPQTATHLVEAVTSG